MVSLVVGDIRKIVGLASKSNNGDTIQFTIDVEPVPLPENPAHAEICAIPGFEEYNGKKAYRKLREHLVFLAEKRWEIRPDI